MARLVHTERMERTGSADIVTEVWVDIPESMIVAIRVSENYTPVFYDTAELKDFSDHVLKVAKWIEDHEDWFNDGCKDIPWTIRPTAPPQILEFKEVIVEEKIVVAGDTFSIFVNQGEREGHVLAVLGDRALIEYEMPAGTTAMLFAPAVTTWFNHSPQFIHNYKMSVSYKQLPKKWLQAIVDQNNGDWWANPQSGKRSVPMLPAGANKEDKAGPS